jgi:hypothetical protein
MTNPSLQVAVPATGALPSRQPAPFLRLRIMVRVGTRMMFHEKLKFAGTLFGVICVFRPDLGADSGGTWAGIPA